MRATWWLSPELVQKWSLRVDLQVGHPPPWMAPCSDDTAGHGGGDALLKTPVATSLPGRSLLTSHDHRRLMRDDAA